VTEPDSKEQEITDAIYSARFQSDDSAHARWRRELWKTLVSNFFSRWIPENATVLDYGCGKGEFINAVTARHRIAVDVRESLRQTLDPDIEFHLATGIELAEIATGSVDIIFCSNVLEHLPDRQTITDLFKEHRRILAPEGRLLILGPNIRFTGAAYWDFFDHLIPLTHKTLIEALATANFETEELIPRFLPYTTTDGKLTPLFLIRLYLRVPLAWRIMGAQFFAVARPKI
jgi:SAM-dependent methyltransferase